MVGAPIAVLISSQGAEPPDAAEPENPEAPLTADQADRLVRTLVTSMVKTTGETELCELTRT